MDQISEEKLENNERPFTELFSLLKRYKNLSDGMLTMAYQPEELKIMHQHTSNAIELLLLGLQNIGHLIGTINYEKNEIDEINNIGFFIAAITNLTEALNNLRADTDYILRQSGINNY